MLRCFVAIACFGLPVAVSAEENPTRAYLTTHCLKCHNSTKQAGDVRLDDLPDDPIEAPERWLAIRDQIRDGFMPPSKEPRPNPEATRALLNRIATMTANRAAKLPNHGNLIPHELLFGKPAGAVEPPLPRVWRLSPDAYVGFVKGVYRGRPPITAQPFSVIAERGFKDFAGLYTIDEPTTDILIRNAELIVDAQLRHEIKDGKLVGKNDSIKDFLALLPPNPEPSRSQLDSAIRLQFKLAIGRGPTADETTRFLDLYRTIAAKGDRAGAVKTMLQAVLLKTDAMFRSELGSPGPNGRRMLTGNELVLALSLALSDQRDLRLEQASAKGLLTTRDRIAEQLRLLLDDPKTSKPRILRFFQEYFGYTNATNVFKEKPATFVHVPKQYIDDTDRLILHILAQDKEVFRTLLTTPESFVNYTTFTNKQKGRIEEGKPAVVLNPNNDKGKQGVEYVYGVAKWVPEQPMRIPNEQRLGILMQPSWLTAWSVNFDNDPVRRGRWIREKLLGGTVPELPIGVAAQVPDEPHNPLRTRLRVTRDARCWKCHQKMDELGLPFEQFDHYGRYRTTESVLDPDATAKNVDKKGRHLGPVTREVPLPTTGTIHDSGEAGLDGPIHDPRELVRKLADSPRARQVFIRHVFRYFLGRNETLADAKTLQDADAAYLASGGSFKALLIALLTSDSFLYRSAPLLTGDRR